MHNIQRRKYALKAQQEWRQRQALCSCSLCGAGLGWVGAARCSVLPRLGRTCISLALLAPVWKLDPVLESYRKPVARHVHLDMQCQAQQLQSLAEQLGGCWSRGVVQLLGTALPSVRGAPYPVSQIVPADVHPLAPSHLSVLRHGTSSPSSTAWEAGLQPPSSTRSVQMMVAKGPLSAWEPALMHCVSAGSANCTVPWLMDLKQAPVFFPPVSSSLVLHWHPTALRGTIDSRAMQLRASTNPPSGLSLKGCAFAGDGLGLETYPGSNVYLQNCGSC